jgi:hypothetical protein
MIMYFLFFKNKACVLFCHARGPTRHRHSCCNESAAAADAIWLAVAWQRGLLAHLLPCLHSPGPTVTIISPKSKLPCLSCAAENHPLAAPATKSPARCRNPVPGEDRPLSSAAGRLVSAARFLVPGEDRPLSPCFEVNLVGILPRLPAVGLEHVR